MKLFWIACLFILSPPSLAAPPQRLVVLSPALTEIVFALGEGSRVVGTTEFSDYPDAARSVARVGSYSNPSSEKIIALKPDMVLVSDEGVDTVSELLTRANIKVRVYRMKSLNDYEKVVTDLGLLFRARKAKDILIADWREEMRKLRTVQASHRVIIQVDHDPIYIAGTNTFLSEVIERCGSVNELKEIYGYRRPIAERLARSKPSVILVTAHMKKPTLRQTIANFWHQQPISPKPHMLFVDPDLLSRLSPRLPRAALDLCKKLKSLSRKPVPHKKTASL